MKNKKMNYLMIFVCTVITFIIVGCSNKRFDNFEIGQTLKIGSEEFWIIDINDKDITAIAKYNLLVGNICESTDNITFDCNEIDSDEIGYGLQNQ